MTSSDDSQQFTRVEMRSKTSFRKRSSLSSTETWNRKWQAPGVEEMPDLLHRRFLIKMHWIARRLWWSPRLLLGLVSWSRMNVSTGRFVLRILPVDRFDIESCHCEYRSLFDNRQLLFRLVRPRRGDLPSRLKMKSIRFEFHQATENQTDVYLVPIDG